MNRVLLAWIIFSAIAFGCWIAGLWYPPVRTAWIGAFVVFTWLVIAYVQAMPKRTSAPARLTGLHWERGMAHIEFEGEGGTITMRLSHEEAERLQRLLSDPRRSL